MSNGIRARSCPTCPGCSIAPFKNTYTFDANNNRTSWVVQNQWNGTSWNIQDSIFYFYTDWASGFDEFFSANPDPFINPNPNDGTMWLNYTLTDGKDGRLLIYDSSGRMVNHFILNKQNSSFQVNLIDGIYFYNLLIKDQSVKTNKLVIIK